jgi:hypothetical protein
MSALTPALERFLDEQIVGVLATHPPHAPPRQSVVYFARERDRLLITTLADRRKARDVKETSWASLCVMGHERPFPSATFSGPAEILTQDIGRPTALVAQRVMGSEDPPEPQTEEALAAAGRVILAITIEHVAAVTHLDR